MTSDLGPGGPGAAHPAQLGVGVIGVGRVGAALAVALGRAGHQVVAASGVSEASRQRIGRLLPGMDMGSV